jgi:hypothetical protein
MACYRAMILQLERESIGIDKKDDNIMEKERIHK